MSVRAGGCGTAPVVARMLNSSNACVRSTIHRFPPLQSRDGAPVSDFSDSETTCQDGRRNITKRHGFIDKSMRPNKSQSVDGQRD